MPTRRTRKLNLNKCKYVFQQGQKSGKKCNKNCRGEYCKDHNAHRLECNQKKVEAKSNERRGDTNAYLLQIREATSVKDLPDREKIRMKLEAYNDKARVFIYKCFARKIVIGKAVITDYNGKHGLNTKYDRDKSKVERHEKFWIEKKKGNKIVEMTDEERQRKYERFMKKRAKISRTIRLMKEILKAYDKKKEEFSEAAEYIEDELDAIEEI